MTDSDHIMQLRQQVANLHASQVKARAERDEAVYEIERLRGMLEVQDEMMKHYVQERDEAKSKVERIMEGLEGTCMTCEPVGVRNQQMVQDIKTLQDQRDEARREVCAWQGATSGKSFKDTAAVRGWNCFNEDSK